MTGLETTPTMDWPVPFGHRCAWLAVNSANPQLVIATLPVRNTKPATWQQGIDAAYQGHVFVSPPGDGWVLVVSTALPSPGDEWNEDTLTPFVTRASRKMATTVDYYATHRTVEYHAWVRAVNGVIIRGYTYVGDQGLTRMDVGDQTSDELALGFRFFDEKSVESRDPAYWHRKDMRYPDGDDVLNISARWSVDTQALDSREEYVGPGWIGEL